MHGRLDLERVAAPLIKELARRCGETVELIVPYDDHGMCIYAEESSSPLRLSPGRGQRLPLYIGASEQVLLAWLPEEVRERVLSGPLTPMTPNTGCDPQVLRERLELIRRQGYMITMGRPTWAPPASPPPSSITAGPCWPASPFPARPTGWPRRSGSRSCGI